MAETPQFIYRIPEIKCYRCARGMMTMSKNDNLWFWCPNCQDWMNFLWQCKICGNVLDIDANYCSDCVITFDIASQDMPMWGIPEFSHLLQEQPFKDIGCEWKIDIDGDIFLCNAIFHTEGAEFWWAWFRAYWENEATFCGPYETVPDMVDDVKIKILEWVESEI